MSLPAFVDVIEAEDKLQVCATLFAIDITGRDFGIMLNTMDSTGAIALTIARRHLSLMVKYCSKKLCFLYVRRTLGNNVECALVFCSFEWIRLCHSFIK